MINNYLTTKETAEVLEMSVFTIRLWLQKGKIKGTQLSGIWLIPNDEVERIKKERAPLLKKKTILNRIFG